MVKSLIFLIIIFTCILNLYSQNEQNEIKLKTADSLSIENNSNYGLIQNIPGRDFLLPELEILINELTKYDSFSFDVNTSLPDKLLPIKFSRNIYEIQSPIAGYQPFFRDFHISEANKIFNKFCIISGSQQVTHYGYGEYFLISGAFHWMPNKNISLDFGGFIAREYNYLSAFPCNISGVNGQLIYYLTDNLQFNIMGQYIAPSQKNIFNGNALFPNSNIGGYLLYKGKGKMQIEVGSKYQYYQNRRGWNAESGGKIMVGF